MRIDAIAFLLRPRSGLAETAPSLRQALRSGIKPLPHDCLFPLRATMRPSGRALLDHGKQFIHRHRHRANRHQACERERHAH